MRQRAEVVHRRDKGSTGWRRNEIKRVDDVYIADKRFRPRSADKTPHRVEKAQWHRDVLDPRPRGHGRPAERELPDGHVLGDERGDELSGISGNARTTDDLGGDVDADTQLAGAQLSLGVDPYPYP